MIGDGQADDLRLRAGWLARAGRWRPQEALELGGTDEGPAGLRAVGGDGFYAGYFRDLDGNKLDVFCYG